MQYLVLLTDGSQYSVASSTVDNLKAAAVSQPGKSPLVDVEIQRKKKATLITLNVNQIVAIIENSPETVTVAKL